MAEHLAVPLHELGGNVAAQCHVFTSHPGPLLITVPFLWLPWDCIPKEGLALKLCLRLFSRESGLSQHLDSNRTEFWFYIP